MAEYIERESLIARLKRNLDACNSGVVEKLCFRYAIMDAQRLPAADVAPVVHARWEQDADGDWYCTRCNEYACICDSGKERTYRKPHCPNCGAKMDGGVDGG